MDRVVTDDLILPTVLAVGESGQFIGETVALVLGIDEPGTTLCESDSPDADI